MNRGRATISEEYLLAALKLGDESAFTLLFSTYYKDLVQYAGNFIKNQAVCEDIVQNVFLKCWNDRESLSIQSSLKSYLLKSVKNSCIDQIRHIDVVNNYSHFIEHNSVLDQCDTDNYILYSDLNTHLREALAKLPILYKEAFELNRFEGLKYKEIAEQLNVSERTIEVRIGKALGLLRKYLKDFFVILVMWHSTS